MSASASQLLFENQGDVQLWIGVLTARCNNPGCTGVGEAIADADSAVRAIRMRVPSIMQGQPLPRG